MRKKRGIRDYNLRDFKRKSKIKFTVVLSFAVGYGADFQLAEQILKKAGLAFDESDETRFYADLFIFLYGKSVDEWNAVLAKKGYPLLGSHERKQ